MKVMNTINSLKLNKCDFINFNLTTFFPLLSLSLLRQAVVQRFGPDEGVVEIDASSCGDHSI